MSPAGIGVESADLLDDVKGNPNSGMTLLDTAMAL